MNAVDAVRSCLRQYATFSGRARRSEYWWFHAFLLAAQAVAVVLELVISLAGGTTYGAFFGLVAVGLFVPALAVTWRRLHDSGRSGAWYFLGLVPFGGIVVLVFTCLDSQPFVNTYGPSPKPVSSAGHGLPQQYAPPQQGQAPQQHGQPQV